jgi:8-oxo-dGTP pyrophosphatase MutT (NUDIX family)
VTSASDYVVRHIDGCELRVAPHRTPREPELSAAIDAAWGAITARRPHVFDGELLSVRGVGVSGGRLCLDVERVGYKDYLVQREGLKLGVRPLAVTGVTLAGDDILIGRRSRLVTQFPGLWEPVPAGTVGLPPGDEGSQDVLAGQQQPHRVEEQLLRELDEEAGIPRESALSVVVIGVIEDASDGVVDVCFRVDVERAQAERAISGRSDQSEHEELRLCSPAEAQSLAADPTAAVPTRAPALPLAGWSD